MKAKDLIEGNFYYCEEHREICQYFVFLKHYHDIDKSNPNCFLIQGINGVEYIGYYPDNDTFRKMTDEEKLELL